MLSGLPQELVVMSENVYMGADPVPIIAASVLGTPFNGGPALTTAAVTQFWSNVKATNFNKRADAIVQQIADNKPDLIGLQEVMTYYSGKADSFWGNPTKANKVELDFLGVLQNKLTAKGLKYQSYVRPLGDFEATGIINGQLRDLRLVDSMVILARNDLPATQVSFSNPNGGVFHEAVEIPHSLIGPITIDRGWNAIDVQWGKSQFHFVNMCLETPVFPVTQGMQAMELLRGLSLASNPVILVGDSNSNGAKPGKPFSVLDNTVTYSLLTANYDWLLPGFTLQDAWTQTHALNDVGYTWGNRPDLKNVQPMDYSLLGLGPYRMDLVLHQDAFQATSMKRVGVDAQTRAQLGMWPSDHAGVVAKLAIKSPTSSTSNMGTSEIFAEAHSPLALLSEQVMELFVSQYVQLAQRASTTLSGEIYGVPLSWLICLSPEIASVERSDCEEFSVTQFEPLREGESCLLATTEVISLSVEELNLTEAPLSALEYELMDRCIDEIFEDMCLDLLDTWAD
jgi:hypothetical protein